MFLDSFAYLMGTYWPFLLVALVIGIATGWFAYTSDKNAAE